MTPDALLALARQRQAQADLHAADNFACMVLERDADHGPALLLRAQLAWQRGQVDLAVPLLVQAMQAKLPQALTFWLEAAQLAQRLEQPALSYTAYQHACALAPENALLWNQLGVQAQAMGDWEQAAHAYQHALVLDEQQAFAHNNYAALLQAQGDYPQALKHFQRCVQLKPDYPIGWRNYGGLLQEVGQFEAALHAYRQACALQADYVEALAGCVYMQLQLADWRELDQQERALRQAMAKAPQARVSPFVLLSLDANPARQLAVARQWSGQFPTQALPARTPTQRARIRLGYLGGDFFSHATSWLTAGLFAAHRRDAFEVWGYDYGPDDGSALRSRVSAGFDRLVSVNTLSQQALAERIRADEIDILIDLKGWTRATRCDVLAWRPAPVQVHYLAYPASLGASWCDYLIADHTVIPSGEERHYQEAIVRLPTCYQINDRARAMASPPSRQAAGLPEQGFVFCCFNQHYKILPGLFDIWMQLLHATPASVLWLMDMGAANRTRLYHEAQRRGIGPERLIFAPALPQAEHLARLTLADLVLDTQPCNAHTTASDALWAGVPLLSCQGEGFASRVAASCLQAAGLPELITHSLAEYRGMALQLAQHPAKLQALRDKLAQQRLSCALFDTAASVAALEQAYAIMWTHALAGQRPAGFDLPPLAG
ncbi:O-linked N-acetylglucosamine transferase, SPINDLY family protein [Chitinimonas taiwanensis]|uniref:O-linked N-acetylglucosamine transferase, SPINDLY family protein n=1 Tax=Chitinimonas taiwanensis TaxID=240412 RepID=UPI0035ADA6A7